MSAFSAPELNSETKNQLNSILTGRTSTSETVEFPNIFHFWNGDVYTGQFAVFKDKQKIAMQGRGVYKTSDDQTYEGIWDNDCLSDDCKITFPDKEVFTGSLDEMVIEGPGRYTFKENVEIDGHFVGNKLTGEVLLKDPNSNQWKGKVDKNRSSVNFSPLHPFWQSVFNLQSKSAQLFYGEAAEENVNIWED